MRWRALRYLALLGLLTAAGVGAWLLEGRRPHEMPGTGAPDGASAGDLGGATLAPRILLHTDVAGWYEVTPDEGVVASPYDLRLAGLPDGLPWTLGGWQGEDLGPDPEIDEWYDGPDLVSRRYYTDGSGAHVWVTIIASRGPKSFRLFEHTPHICYTSTGWASEADDVVQVPLSVGTFAVKRGLFAHDGERRAVYSWYQWDGPSRDPADGVASWRVSTVAAADGGAEARLAAFIRLFLSDAVTWRRF